MQSITSRRTPLTEAVLEHAFSLLSARPDEAFRYLLMFAFLTGSQQFMGPVIPDFSPCIFCGLGHPEQDCRHVVQFITNCPGVGINPNDLPNFFYIYFFEGMNVDDDNDHV